MLKWIGLPAGAFVITMRQVSGQRRTADRQGMPAFLAIWFVADENLATLFTDGRRLNRDLLNNNDQSNFNHQSSGQSKPACG